MISGWRRRCGSCASRRSAPACSSSATIEPGVSLDPEAEVVVYRVAQEAITNALRHAGRGAGPGGARARRAAARVLRVDDDGGGIAAGAEGAGVRGMRERAVLVGAACSRSAVAQGGGTSVTLRLR